MTDSYKFKDGHASKFNPGDTVWAAQGPKPKPTETVVNGVECVLTSQGDEDPYLICVGYRLPLFYFAGDDFGEYWPPCQVYGTLEEAQKDCEWTAVEDVADEEWQQALGSREDDSHYDSELGTCCANLSHVRSLLYQCRDHGGLPLRDRETIKRYLLEAHPEVLEGRAPAIDKIIGKLKLDDVDVELKDEDYK